MIGASGLRAIKACGGTVLVQDPDDAEYPDMPRNALEEKAALVRRLADEAQSRNHKLTARQFERRFHELVPAARTIRSILLKTR